MAQLKSTNITGNLSVTGNVLASKIIKLGGTADEILCADGSTTTLSGLGAGTVTSVGISNGGGLSVTGSPITGAGTITISHADTSTANNLTANGRRYVTGLTFDTYGHVTGYTTGTESVTDTDTGATSVDVTGDGNAITSASYDSTTRKITFTKGATFLTTHQSLSGYLKGSGTTGVIPKFTASDTVGDSNLSLHSSGALQILASNNTTTIGSQNASFCHIYNSAHIPFIFNQGIQVTGNKDLGSSQYDWKDFYLSGSIKKVKSATDTTTYTLTLPDKTGTIALISDLPTIPNITITDTTSATTKPIIGDITVSGHTITVSRIGLDDLGLASAYKYKGSVAKYENLPTSDQEIGDVWNIEDTGMNYAWTGSVWDSLGCTVDLTGYVTLNTAQSISGIKTFTAQPVISTANGLKFDSGNCKLRIYNTSASPTDYAAIEVRSNSTSTNRNLFIDLANNSLVVGTASGTADTTYKVNVKDTFNATTIYENGTALSSKYLGINGTAADSDKLDGQDGSYYLNYNNFTNKPTIPTVNNGTLTMNTSGTGVSGSATFTANQNGNSTFTVTLDSSAAGNRGANKVVLAKAAGQIDSDKFTVTSAGTTKSTIQYNTTEGCLEFVFA